jgi:DnaJ-class molecular chaperone
MNKKDLTRLFRQRAKELHPDQGGNHERFIELSGAYASLLARK